MLRPIHGDGFLGPDFEGLQRWGIFSSSTTHLAQQFPREMWFSTVALGLCVANVAALAPMRVSMMKSDEAPPRAIETAEPMRTHRTARRIAADIS